MSKEIDWEEYEYDKKRLISSMNDFNLAIRVFEDAYFCLYPNLDFSTTHDDKTYLTLDLIDAEIAFKNENQKPKQQLSFDDALKFIDDKKQSAFRSLLELQANFREYDKGVYDALNDLLIDLRIEKNRHSRNQE